MRFIGMVGALLLLSSQAEAKILKISGTSSSSSYPEEKGINYDAKNVKDQKQGSVWVEGEDGAGLGSWVQVDLDGPQTVSVIKLWNGHWFSHDFWERHNRMKDIEVELSDGSKHTFALKDTMAPEVLRLPKSVTTSYVKVRFKSIYKGTTFGDTVVSEIQVMDGAPSTTIPVSSYTSSSTYPTDADGSYEVGNLGDGMIDSVWCENGKTDGPGEWAMFDFGGSRSLQSVTIRNGNTYSFALYMQNPKATDISLTYSDGSTTKHTLKSSQSDQVIPLNGKSTSSVKLTIVGVTKGSDPAITDLCMSEVGFQE